MKSVVDGLVKRVDDVESSQQFISASFEKNKSDVTSIADEITQLRDVNKNVTYQLEYLQCESLRDNLMFFGVEKEEGEDCVDIIKTYVRRLWKFVILSEFHLRLEWGKNH